VVVILTPFLYLPIPSWFYNRLRHSYQLIVKNEGGEADDEPVDDRPQENVFVGDTNLPIRLLFILNSIPLLNAKEKRLKELEFADGSADALAKKLYDLQDHETKDQFEGGSAEEKRESKRAEEKRESETLPNSKVEGLNTPRSSGKNIPGDVRSSELVNPSSEEAKESKHSRTERSYTNSRSSRDSRSYTGDSRSYTGSSYTDSRDSRRDSRSRSSKHSRHDEKEEDHSSIESDNNDKPDIRETNNSKQ